MVGIQYLRVEARCDGDTCLSVCHVEGQRVIFRVRYI